MCNSLKVRSRQHCCARHLHTCHVNVSVTITMHAGSFIKKSGSGICIKSYYKKQNIVNGSAGDAYMECLKTDHMVELLRLEAFGKVKSGAELEEKLKALSSKVEVPEMPKTAAVLQTIPASDEHPGAIYRLAGDRSASSPPLHGGSCLMHGSGSRKAHLCCMLANANSSFCYHLTTNTAA